MTNKLEEAMDRIRELVIGSETANGMTHREINWWKAGTIDALDILLAALSSGAWADVGTRSKNPALCACLDSEYGDCQIIGELCPCSETIGDHADCPAFVVHT